MSRPIKKSNVALLTEGQSYIQRAKKARQDQIAEIKFDDEARREWLTGFHKRKKAKTDERRSRAKERDHLAHLEERKKARQEIRERALENVKNARKAMGLPDEEEGDEDGEDESEEPEAGPSKTFQQEAEYSDEEHMAIVTITEDFDPSTFHNPFTRSSTSPQPAPPPQLNAVPNLPASSRRAQKKAISTKDKDKDKGKNKEKRKVEKEKSRSMETKAERKFGRAKQGKRRVEKANLALERNGKGNKRGSGKASRGGKRGGKR